MLSFNNALFGLPLCIIVLLNIQTSSIVKHSVIIFPLFNLQTLRTSQFNCLFVTRVSRLSHDYESFLLFSNLSCLLVFYLTFQPRTVWATTVHRCLSYHPSASMQWRSSSFLPTEPWNILIQLSIYYQSVQAVSWLHMSFLQTYLAF